VGSDKLAGVRRQVFAAKFTLQANPAKNTKPAKSVQSVKSVAKNSFKNAHSQKQK